MTDQTELDEAVQTLRWIRERDFLQPNENDAIHTVLATFDDVQGRVAELETKLKAALGTLTAAQKRVAGLEAEFTGQIEWTIGAHDEDGKPYYLGSYTEAGARHHAAQRTTPHFPAWRRRTIWHNATDETGA